VDYTKWDYKINEGNLDKLKTKPVTLCSELSEEMEGTHEQNEYKNNPETDFMLSVKRTKINQMSNEEMGGKYKTITCHFTSRDRKRKKKKKKKRKRKKTHKKTVGVRNKQQTHYTPKSHQFYS
jgi:hypothetical protein